MGSWRLRINVSRKAAKVVRMYSSSQLHPALAGEGGILCGSCVRLSVSPVSPSILTTCSTPLPSVAGHPIASRLGAG